MGILLLNFATMILLFLLCFICAYYKHVFNYWYRLGIPYVTPAAPFGNVFEVFTRKRSATEKVQEIYTVMKGQGHRYAGLYVVLRKILLIIDPEIANTILTTHFQQFHDRGLFYDEINEPLSANLVTLDGSKWKNLRSKLSSTFTSGKLKLMFPLILACAEEMIRVLHKKESIEIRDLASRYTTDVIGTCAFGLECNSLKNPDVEFRKYGKRAIEEDYFDLIKRYIMFCYPSAAKKLKLTYFTRSVSDFFMSVFVNTVNYRKQHDLHRNDFLQLLIELMENDNNEDPITMNVAAAQAFVFFLGGFETSGSTITFLMYELATNNKIQNKLRAEISNVLQENNGKFTYNSIMDMPYLEAVVQETLRKWPVLTILFRTSRENYVLPGTQVTIEKNTPVIIPMHAIQHDPEYYPNPEIFDPSRFELEKSKKNFDKVYFPFGNGPRICIGQRFGLMQIKIALVTLLSNFQFTINRKTNCPLVLDKSSINLSPLSGVWLNLLPLKKTEKL